MIDATTDTATGPGSPSLMAGLRQGEALALTWDRVRLDVLEVRQSASRVRGQGMVVGTPKTPAGCVTWRVPRRRLGCCRRGARSPGQAAFPGLRGPDVVEDARRDYDVWRAALGPGWGALRPAARRPRTAESHMATVGAALGSLPR